MEQLRCVAGRAPPWKWSRANGRGAHEGRATRNRSSMIKAPHVTLNTGTPRPFALQSRFKRIDAIDGCTLPCLRKGLMARSGTHGLDGHHFECATIKGVHKVSCSALRYNVLSSLLFPHCLLTDALLPLLYCTAPHLAAFGRSTIGDRRHPGRRHSQQGC